MEPNLTKRFLVTLWLLLCISSAFASVVTANFNYQNGCNGQVTFIATNTTYDTYTWLFGDNTTGTGSATYHQYTPGTYQVTLLVQSPNGSDSLTQQLYVGPYLQQQLTGPAVVCSGSTALYSLSNAQSSFQYSWLASVASINGNSHGQQAQLNFDVAGQASVSVIISNGIGCDSVLHQAITIEPTPNLLLAGQSNDSGSITVNICQNMPVWYHVISTTGSQGNVTWSSGTGTPLTAQGPDSMLYLFPQAGSTYIRAIETTSAGCADTISASVTVYPAPTATATATNACLGSNNIFSASAQGGSSFSYQWVLDDGTTSDINTFNHTFASTGSHDATLIVTNQSGCTDTTTTTVQVDANAGPPVECVGPVCAGDKVVYSTPAVPGVNYHWAITGGAVTAGGGLNDHTIEVQWGNGAMGHIELYLTGPGINCAFPTVINVPLVGGALAIQGDATPCSYTTSTYTTDVIPGGVYNWTVTNGSIQSGQGTHEISVYWYSQATSVSVQVDHQILSCSSSASLAVTPKTPFSINAANKACAGTTQSYYVWPGNSNYNWTVQGGNIISGNGTSTVQINWPTEGVYTVVATNNTDYCNTESTFIVTVTQPVIENITGPDKTCEGETEVYTMSPQMTSYNWSVLSSGTINGSSLSNQTEIHFTVAGNANIQLTYTDVNYCSVTTSYNVDVAPKAVPAFAGDTVTCYGNTETYTFTAIPGVDYVWETEGGIIINGQGTATVSVMWLGNQIGLLRLRNVSCNTFMQKNIVIRPTPKVTIEAQNLDCIGTSADLKVIEDYPGYLWNTSATTQALHITNTGTYTVTVTDAFGCTATGTRVANPMPSNAFAYTSILVNAPGGPIPYAYLKLTATGYPAPVSYVWSTGNTEADQYVSTAGTYSVTMTNEYGCTGTASIVVTTGSGYCSGGGGSCNSSSVVLPCPGINPVFTTNTPLCNPIQFTPGVSATYYHWRFNDGVVSTSANPTHHFSSAGVKNIDLFYSNDGSTWYQCSQSITINSVINGTFTQVNGCKGQVQLTNTSTSTLPLTSINWQLGDGNTASGNIVNYQYPNNAASYTVTLTVSDGTCTESFQRSIDVHQLSTAFNYTGICTNNPALFTDATVHTRPISSYSWSFGNTETADYFNPVTYYRTAGNYTVSLTIKDADGCTDTKTQNITVNDFTQPTPAGNGPLTFCKGSQVILSLPANNSYYWNTAETSNTVTVTQAGEYYAWFTDVTTGCSGFSDTVQVIVNNPPQPYISVDGNKASLCEGEQLRLYGWVNKTCTFQWQLNAQPIAGQTSQYLYNWYANTNQTGDYTLVITDANGCTATSSALHIDVHPGPAPFTITESPTGQHCAGDAVTLNITGTDLYYWSTGAWGNSITTQQTGNYVVLATNQYGCTSNGNHYVSFSTSPDMRYFPTGCYQICASDNITVSGPANQATYQWSNGASTASITLTTSGDYSLSATANDGCTAVSSSFHVDVFDSGNIQLGNDTTICPGMQVLLDAGVYSSFLWNTGATTQTITATDTGTYIVQVTNLQGCQSADTIHIGNFGNTVLLGNDTVICAGNPVILDAGIQNTYLWSTGITTQTITVTDTGSYSVSVTATNGCTAADTIHIGNTGIGLVLGNDTQICTGGTLVLDAGIYTSYLWQDNTTTQTFTANAAGLYFVEVTNTAGCTGRDSITITTLTTTLPTVIDTLCDDAVTITILGNYYTYLWNTGANTASIDVNTTGNYTYTVTNAVGCEATGDVTVVECRQPNDDCNTQFMLPNAFTPNNDGNNDEYKAMRRSSSHVPQYFQLSIFNRWGEQVFQSYNENEGWNGRYKSQEQPPQVYTYAVKYVCENESIVKRGTITLIR